MHGDWLIGVFPLAVGIFATRKTRTCTHGISNCSSHLTCSEYGSKWLVEAKEEKVLEKEAPSVTEKFYVITSKVSLNQLSVVWLAVVVYNVSLDWSMKKHEEYWKFSWKTSSVMQLPTLSTQKERPSPPWMLSTPWNVKDVLSTDSVDKFIFPTTKRLSL